MCRAASSNRRCISCRMDNTMARDFVVEIRVDFQVWTFLYQLQIEKLQLVGKHVLGYYLAVFLDALLEVVLLIWVVPNI